MKKLFTSFIMLLAAVSMSAQDTSTWEKGQEVTADLEWINTKYEGDNSGWSYTQTGGNGVGYHYDTEKAPTGAVELFNNGVGSEFYQVFWLPAGYYKFTVQGFYRPGSAWAAGWDTNTDQNGQFFCDAVNVNEADDGTLEITDVTTKNNVMLMLIVDERGAYQGTNKILTDEMCGDWQRDNGFTRDGNQWWVPNSMWGTTLYFNMSDKVYENELMVINPTDGYVKVGIRKYPDTIGDDWIIFNNFRAYYISDAGEAVQQILAKNEYDAAYADAEKLQTSIAANYGALAALMGDALSEVNDDLEETIEGYKAGADQIAAVKAQFENYLADAKKLSALIEKCKSIAEKLSDVTFTAAVEAAVAVEQDGNGEAEMTIDEPEEYAKAFTSLYEARTTCLTSQEKVNGAYDFTSMINFPWFCNEEHNPVWNAEEGRWYFSDYVLNGDGTLEGYGSVGETSDTYKQNTGKVVIADKVKIPTKETVGSWYQVGTSAYEPYFNHQYTSAKQWAMPGANREICQVLTELPNGFYSAAGYGMTWGNDWDKAGIDPEKTCHMGVYIESGEQKSVSEQEPIYSGWWQGWHPGDWVDYTTSMIEVTDGTAKVAFFANGFSSFTGMRLYYYGTTPDFAAMIAPEIEAVKAIELQLAGDKATVAELIAKAEGIQTTDYESFATVRGIINEASNYAKAAAVFSSSWTTPDSKFAPLQDKYDAESTEYAILDKAYFYALDYPTTADATYLGEQAIDKAYDGYEKYMNARAKMVVLNDAELNTILEKQATALSNEFASFEKMEEYLAELAAPYNKAYLASVGADKASENNPVDVTALIENPAFENGKYGWDGDFAVNWGNGESWNTSSFKITQTIYNLPKGCYRVEAQAFYRDGGDANTAFANYWTNGYWDEDAETRTDNAKLIANDNSVSIVSIASELFAKTAMPGRYDYNQVDQIATDIWLDEHEGKEDYDENHKEYVWIDAFDEEGNFNPNKDAAFDQTVDEMELYFYPNSQEGANKRFAASPNAYHNAVEVYLSEAGNLTFGVAKYTSIANDWCVFDNFKLFYLGAEPTTAINSNAVNTTAAGIYSVNGIRKSALSSGINIVKMSNGAVKKIIVK